MLNRAGVKILCRIPLHAVFNSQLSDDKIADGYPLNREGQKIFTAVLAEFLRKQVEHDL